MIFRVDFRYFQRICPGLMLTSVSGESGPDLEQHSSEFRAQEHRFYLLFCSLPTGDKVTPDADITETHAGQLKFIPNNNAWAPFIKTKQAHALQICDDAHPYVSLSMFVCVWLILINAIKAL